MSVKRLSIIYFYMLQIYNFSVVFLFWNGFSAITANGLQLHVVLTEGKNYFETEDVRSSSGLRTSREAAIRCYGSPKGFRSILIIYETKTITNDFQIIGKTLISLHLR